MTVKKARWISPGSYEYRVDAYRSKSKGLANQKKQRRAFTL